MAEGVSQIVESLLVNETLRRVAITRAHLQHHDAELLVEVLLKNVTLQVCRKLYMLVSWKLLSPITLHHSLSPAVNPLSTAITRYQPAINPLSTAINRCHKPSPATTHFIYMSCYHPCLPLSPALTCCHLVSPDVAHRPHRCHPLSSAVTRHHPLPPPITHHLSSAITWSPAVS
jgi:hypothetical protein